VSDITDWTEGGIWPLQHHDPTFSVKGRRRMASVRLHPAEGDNFTPAGQTYGDISGGLLWEEVAGAREFLHTWFLTGPGVVSQGSPAASSGTQTQADKAAAGGGWLPIFKAGAEPIADTRFRSKSPAIPDLGGGAPKFPKGHTGIVTAGTDEYSQQETLHPDWLGYLVAVNEEGSDPSYGTFVYDVDAEGKPSVSARLQSFLAVLEDGHTAWQFGAAGRNDATGGGGLVVDYGRNEGAYLSTGFGGPLMTGTPFCRHGAIRNLGGIPIKPGHISTGAYFCGPQGDGPLDFDGEPYPTGAIDLPQPVAAHIRFDGSEFKVHSSCSFFIPPPDPTDEYLVKRDFTKPLPPFPPPPQPPPLQPPPLPPGDELVRRDPGDTGPFTPPPPIPGPVVVPPLGELLKTFQGGTILRQPTVGGQNGKAQYPHSTTCLAVPNIILKATATTTGQRDPTVTATPTDEDRRNIANAPQVGHFAAIASGDGTWTGFTPYQYNSPDAHAMGTGSVVFLPPNVSTAQLVAGTASTTEAQKATLAFPSHSQIGFGTPSQQYGTVTSGVVMRAAAGMVNFYPTNSAGVIQSSPRLSFGEGGTVVTGKLTVTGRLDPTTLEFTDTVTDNIPDGTAGFRFDSATSHRPIWKRADDNSDNTLAYLSDVGGGTITDRAAFTPTGNWTTNTTYTGFTHRVNDMQYSDILILLSGAPGVGGNLTLGIPNSETVDEAKLTVPGPSYDHVLVGTFETIDDAAVDIIRMGLAYYDISANNIILKVANDAGGVAGAMAQLSSTVPFTYGANDVIQVHIRLPISGW
jgi:hypothetical protein